MLTTIVVDIVICACAVLADLVVMIVTWRRTYRSWQAALRLGEPRPVMNLLLRDGGRRHLTDYFSTYYVCSQVPCILRKLTFMVSHCSHHIDSGFISMMLILNVLELVVMRALVTSSSVRSNLHTNA